LVISLDFELHWGVRDKRSVSDYRTNLLGVRRAIPAILGLFEQSDLHATWAVVGMLFFDNKTELLRHLPEVRPNYTNLSLSAYEEIDRIGDDEASDPYHYGRSLIEQIQTVAGQELGTHTFSHYYCLEAGQTPEAFRQDLRAAIRAAKILGIELRSLVFPRNQYNAAYVEICREVGITSFRGNERSWFYRERNEEEQNPAVRGARLLDTYVNLSGHNCYSTAALAKSRPFNIPSSRFLRPWSSRLRHLDRLRMRRIKAAMNHAARHGMVFHLWWHPHNFGANLDNNMAVLREIAEHFGELKKRYAFESLNMGDLATRFAELEAVA